MSMHESFLTYRNFRYLKAGTLLAVASIAVYAVYNPIGSHNGGTWLGYTLGTIGFGLIAWLLYLGVRKRQYDKGPTQIKSWVSAHVYLGLSLLVVGTLHTGFQFGWNVHTLAYALMVIVIVSGLFGIYAYARYPSLVTQNRGGQTADAMLREIADLDRQARDLAMAYGDEVAGIVRDAQENTRLGGSAWSQLGGSEAGCATRAALGRVQALSTGTSAEMGGDLGPLLGILSRKSALLRRFRRDLQYRALMEVWLYVHVPISVALMVALTVHVISVFFYW